MHLPKTKPNIINQLTSSIDIAPTILDFINKEKIKADGKSLLPLIKTNKPIRNNIISVDGFCKDRTAIRTKNIKLIISNNPKCYLCGDDHTYNQQDKKEEYDLEKDPEELNNIYKGKNKLEEFLISSKHL